MPSNDQSCQGLRILYLDRIHDLFHQLREAGAVLKWVHAAPWPLNPTAVEAPFVQRDPLGLRVDRMSIHGGSAARES